MSDSNIPTPDPASATEQHPPETDAQSVLSILRKSREQLGTKAKPLDLVVPGYDGLLLIRYKWISFKSLNAGAQDLTNVKDPSEAQYLAASDLIVTCAEDVLIRVDGVVKPLADSPVFIGDPRLDEALGLPTTDTVLETVHALFGGNEYALIRCANTVALWLQDTTLKIDEEYLGN